MTDPGRADRPGPEIPAAGLPEADGADSPTDETGSRTLDPAPATPAFADISLSARRLVGGAFDLMARSERDLRYTSFYLGFVALVTIGPVIALFWAFVVRFGIGSLDSATINALAERAPSATGWLAVALLVAVGGFIALAIESQATAIAVLGSRLQGRPLNVSGAVRLARRRFWRVFWAGVLVNILTRIGQYILELVAAGSDPAQAQLWLVADVVVTILIQTPFIYAVAGIVLGEVGVTEALRRSTRLFAARPGLALTVALFGAATQLLLVFGLSTGIDLVVRIAEPFGLGQGGVAIFLGTIIGSALTFAFGTLLFTAAALAAAPQVIAFVGLTHYVAGLDYGREPYTARRPWDPFISGGLWVAIVLGLTSLFLGIAALP